jgi:ribose-phosphate pyrophosphokinase
MTTLALLPERLKRLFSRFDAAGAHERSLELALDHWQVKRGDRLWPKLSDIDPVQLGPLAQHVFVFERSGDDWRLRFAGDAAKTDLGAPADKPMLSNLTDDQVATRLRQLLEWVEQTGELVSASFVSPHQDGEFLVAPLSDGGDRVEAVFGGIISRKPQGAD